jgi:O-antigen ligase/polysaccharide polymerase Wzy-like membrane protein
MTILKYITLILILWNIPSFALLYFGSSVGGALSVAIFGCILLYFFLNKKYKASIPFVILGISYFMLSGLTFYGEFSDYLKDVIRYFAFVMLIAALMHNTSTKQLVAILLIGALSVIVHSLGFQSEYGRYAGFYINPNQAGFICLVGYAFTYRITNTKLKLIFQFVFTVAGILTLSRYFILVWVIVNVLSVISNRKNIQGLAIGGLTLILIFTISAMLNLNQNRFAALESLFTNKVDTKTLTQESRIETWTKYNSVLLENPLLGNGYRSMQGKGSDTVGIDVGVHNTFLMVFGESGIVPFLLFIIIYISLAIRSLRYFKIQPEYSFLALILITELLVSHNYFDNFIVLFFTIWLYVKVKNETRTQSDLTLN